MTDPSVFRANRLRALDAELTRPASALRLEGTSQGSAQAWFLGPKAENEALLVELIEAAIRAHCDYRRAFHPEDPIAITAKDKLEPSYERGVAQLRGYAAQLFEELRKSAPIFSMRHQGHMLWDQALPAVVGYFAGMLYNQNNVAAEASPVTTRLEIEVGNDLCRMLGYDVPDEGETRAPGAAVRPWGHITCDGSVANIESLWAARNLKFYPVALREALLSDSESGLKKARTLEIARLDGGRARLVDLDGWELLNLAIDEVLGLPAAIEAQFGIDGGTTARAVKPFSPATLGMLDLYRSNRSLASLGAPVVVVPATRHYSWPKAATLLGLGEGALRNVHVDLDARMELRDLRATLERCAIDRVPVLSVVAVVGSTEESAVDPLREILAMRDDLRKKGLHFAVHADAAWGGYFNCMLRPDEDPRQKDKRLLKAFVPESRMSEYVRRQYAALRDADSITVDPHKAGYVPYPAGGLCYRNSAMRDLVSLAAPVVFHSQSEPTVGIYGVEGSKPGAAAASVYLAHKVIRPTAGGYGKILGQCIWTSKRLYARLATMQDEKFRAVVFQRLPSERRGESGDGERAYIRDHFVNVSNRDLDTLLHQDPYAAKLFREMGSDQVILAYSFNMLDERGAPNKDVGLMNDLNLRVFELCSVTRETPLLEQKKLIVTNSSFDPQEYGEHLVADYARRLGVDYDGKTPVQFLISTTMDPWTTDTPDGDFLEVVAAALRDAVLQAIEEMKNDGRNAAVHSSANGE